MKCRKLPWQVNTAISFLIRKNIQNVLNTMVLTLKVYSHSSVSLPLSALIPLLNFFISHSTRLKCNSYSETIPNRNGDISHTPYNIAWESSNDNGPHVKNETHVEIGLWPGPVTHKQGLQHCVSNLTEKNLMSSFNYFTHYSWRFHWTRM